MTDDIYAAIEERGAPAREASVPSATAEGARPYNREEYAARKQAERESAYALIDTATERITKDPSAFAGYLDIMARFPRLSAANALLVFEQMPDATRLGDFEFWKGAGASVRRGASAITILVPGDEYTREDGTIGTSFNAKKLFDERQTTARHLEPRHPDTESLLLALIETSPVGIKAVDAFEQPLIQALYNPETRTIAIKKELAPQAIFKALATELAHAGFDRGGAPYDREANAGAAMLAGYVAARRHGIDASDIMPVYVPRSEGESLQDVRAELGRVRGAAKEISGRIDKALEASRQQPKVQQAVPGQRASVDRGGRDGR
jgi:hypothetical protein